MKAIKLALAISLAVNLALCWKLSTRQDAPPAPRPMMNTSWEQPRPEPASLRVPSLLGTPGSTLPGNSSLQPASVPLSSPSQPSPVPSASTDAPTTTPPQQQTVGPDGKPYGDALPPNPHAVPPWEKREPYRESQVKRGLYENPEPKVETPLK